MATGLLAACVIDDPGFRIIVPVNPNASLKPDSFPTPTGPSTSPKATPKPPAFATGLPLDVAISGPGYFVLAKEEGATDLAGLTLTRYGAFQMRPWAAEGTRPAGARLVAEQGLLAWGIAWDEAGRLPEESRGSSFGLAFTLGGKAVGPLAVHAAPALSVGALALGVDGRLGDSQGGSLFDADGRAIRLALVVVQVERPEAMVALGGGRYRPTREAGPFQVGLAGSPRSAGALARPVGDSCTLRPGFLESVGE